MTNYERNDYELNSALSEETNKVMKKYDVRYLKYLTDNLNRVIELSERKILCDEEVTELEESLIFVSNNLKNTESLKIYNEIIDDLREVFDEVLYENEFKDNVVNI
jgi:hypothetical protein